MSANSSDDKAVTSRGYSAGGNLVAYPRPDEVVVPLRRDEFDTLCEGGASEEKASRDLCIGVGATALVGLVGVLATTDWNTTWKPDRRWWFLIPLLVFSVTTVGSIVGVWIYQLRLNRIISNSPFSRVRAKLVGLFNEPRTLEAAIEKLPDVAARQVGARSGIKWENVANVFWLGSDLHWTDWKVRSGAVKQKVLHGLTQSDYHSFQLGLADTTAAGKQLSALRLEVKNLSESDLEGRRDYIASKISVIVSLLDVLVKLQQPNFQPNPER
jgi:hypothetical protein